MYVPALLLCVQGHLRSTIVGDCISNAYEFMGHNVKRVNHIGDWYVKLCEYTLIPSVLLTRLPACTHRGTQFGMLIHFLKTEHPDFCRVVTAGGGTGVSLNGQANPAELMDITQLAVVYKLARAAFEADADGFQSKSRAEVVSLQRHDEDSVAIWKYLCEVSKHEFQKIYDILGVRIAERGESFYSPMLSGIVERLLLSGVAVRSEQAVVVYVPAAANGALGTSAKEKSGKKQTDSPIQNTAVVLQKSDGGYLYATTDLAAIAHRFSPEGDRADEVIYVTDVGQAGHFAK